MDFRKSLHTLLHPDPLGSCIGPNEHVVFFPTAADFQTAGERGGGCWHVPIHGWIYTPAEFSRLRRAGLWFAKHFVSRTARQDAPAMALFQARAGAFLADNERWQRVTIRLGDMLFKLKRSAPSGHFQCRLEVPAEHVYELLTRQSPQATDSGPWLSFRALTRTDDTRIFDGRVLLLPPEGISVISDIDDTIKITQVASRRKMLASTFLKEFASVPQMAALYQRWAKGGAAFHYVSASPWHLHPFLAEFLGGQGFPEGTFHLRDLRLLPPDLHRTFRPSRHIKLRHARVLLERFPRRRFILVGDSGESDPAIYARLCRDFPRQVQKICIRNVSGDLPSASRWAKIRAQMPREKFQLFTHPEEIVDF